jgi:hypothetical protein
MARSSRLVWKLSSTGDHPANTMSDAGRKDLLKRLAQKLQNLLEGTSSEACLGKSFTDHCAVLLEYARELDCAILPESFHPIKESECSSRLISGSEMTTSSRQPA